MISRLAAPHANFLILMPCRCHRCILAARSDFLGALLEQPLKKREGHMTHAALTEHEQQPRSPGTFWQNAYLPSEVLLVTT